MPQKNNDLPSIELLYYLIQKNKKKPTDTRISD